MVDCILQSPLSKNLRMIITSDHGEGFAEEYSLYDRKFLSNRHGEWPCPSQIEIPLIVYNSQEPEGRSLDSLVGLDNIAPTIRFWAGISGKSNERYLFNRSERAHILSEAIPLERRTEGRGVLRIDAAGGYGESYVLDIENNSISRADAAATIQEMPEELKARLESLGYVE
jgi:hypothetical protein